MNIGIVLLYAGVGGHVRSTIATAEALVSLGHSVTFILDHAENNYLIESAGFRTIFTKRNWKGLYTNIQAAIAQANVQIVHSFIVDGYPETVIACKKSGIPCMLTICGGTLSKKPVELSPIAVFSEELRDMICRCSSLKPDDIHVIPGRIKSNKGQIEHRIQKLSSSFRERYNIPGDSHVVMRVARLDKSYYESIVAGALAAKNLYEKGQNVRFVYIGKVDSQKLFNKVKDLFREINQSAGAQISISAQDEAVDGSDYFNLASVAIGVGRSAFEPMSCGIPTLIYGSRGYVGTVNDANIDDIAYYNFSGRNLKSSISIDESVGKLESDISQLLSDSSYRKRVIEFNKLYVQDKLSVTAAAKAYTEIYEGLVSEKQSFPSDEILQSYCISFIDYIKSQYWRGGFKGAMLSFFKR